MNQSENRINVTLRNYQEDAIEFINENDGKLVLAMCPSSGKTETIIHYINQQFKSNPNVRVLILPHSTNVLLDNFYERLESRTVDFTYSAEITDDVNVHVILPQNHNRIIGKYDLVIIDEAHENYLAKTIQGIIKKTQPKKEILLTGTPSKFIGNDDFKLHFVALSDLCEIYTPKLRIDILESDYDWNGNYDKQTKELKNSYQFTKESTENSLKKTFDFLLKRNKSNSVEKTLIVCRNIAQSNYVKDYLTSIGFVSDISNSENDKDSENISKFKNNLIDILIVVNRARLGYDDADLINLIDISGTLNPNIIYQMFARLLRGTKDMKKYYIRLTSKDDDYYDSEIATSVSLMLTHSNYIQVFNGKNFNSQEIIVRKDFFYETKKLVDKSKKERNTSNKRKLLIDLEEDDFFDIISLFKEVIEEEKNNTGLYKFCKVSEVLNTLGLKIGVSRTKEECIENARKYKSISEWLEKDRTIQQYSYKKEWYNECTAHMERIGGEKRTKEECIENALKYNSIKEWKKNDYTIQSYSYTKEWYSECTAHMEKLNGQNRTKEECIENALKYNSIKEWRETESVIYGYAIYKGWVKECTAHMVNASGETRTKEECIENARKYTTKKDWRIHDSAFYSYAISHQYFNECTAHMKNLGGEVRTKEECILIVQKYDSISDFLKNDKLVYMYLQRKGWLKECTSHLVNSRAKTRTKEECIENAKKYTTKKDWRINDYTIYNYSVNRGYFKECTAHMMSKQNTDSINSIPKFRTKEECIENAKKYNSLSDWRKNDATIYRYSLKKNWYSECTAHMNILRKVRTKEECIENAKKYKSISEWSTKDNSFYSYAITRKDYYEECIAHMEILKRPRTKEECIESARKYKLMVDWRKNDSAFYNYSIKKGWYQECVFHMEIIRKVRTKEECIENARTYKSMRDWVKNDSAFYNYARKREWFSECKVHFVD